MSFLLNVVMYQDMPLLMRSVHSGRALARFEDDCSREARRSRGWYFNIKQIRYSIRNRIVSAVLRLWSVVSLNEELGMIVVFRLSCVCLLQDVLKELDALDLSL